MGGCQCGNQMQHSSAPLGCLDCGGATCPRCAVALESASYCRKCAGELLGTPVETTAPFELAG
jgi:hypothetical protein